jgi:hypothetical protein
MLRKWIIITGCLLLGLVPALAQDGIDLPAPLYVLNNTGQVQRLGLGAEGLTTITPEDVFILDFGIAPDDAWIAYRTESELAIVPLYGSGAPALTLDAGLPPARGRGDTVAWAPTGDALAYTTDDGAGLWLNRFPEPITTTFGDGNFVELIWSPDGRYLAAEADNAVWWVYQRVDASMELAAAIPASLGLAWSGGDSVIFAPPEGGLVQLSLMEGNAQTPLQEADAVYGLPLETPEGILYSFRRPVDDETIPQGYGELIATTPENGEPEVLGSAALDLSDLRWAPTGRLLARLQSSQLSLVTPAGEVQLPFEDVVAYSWGPVLPRVRSLILSSNGYFRSIGSGESAVTQVWRLPADGTDPVAITVSTADVTDYVVAQNEQALLYATGDTLWWLGLNGTAAAARLFGGEGVTVDGLRINAQNSLVAFHAETATTRGIWLLGTDTRTAEADALPAPLIADGQPEADAVYTPVGFLPNAGALIINKTTAAGTSAMLLDTTSQELLPLVLDQGVQAVLADGSGLILDETETGVTIGRLDTFSAQVVPLAQLPAGLFIEDVRTLDSVGKFVVRQDIIGPAQISVVDINLGDGAILAGRQADYLYDPQLSPDGRFVAGYTRPDAGSLSFRDLQTNTQVIWNNFTDVRQFQWVR